MAITNALEFMAAPPDAWMVQAARDRAGWKIAYPILICPRCRGTQTAKSDFPILFHKDGYECLDYVRPIHIHYIQQKNHAQECTECGLPFPETYTWPT